MRTILAAVLFLAFQSGHSQAKRIAAPDPVKLKIQEFFTAFHARDTTKIKMTFAKEIVLHSIADGKNGPELSVEYPAQFLKSLATVPPDVKFEEKLLSWKIDTDGNLAHVWTPYEFYINGKLSHKGVNSFELFKGPEGWKILYCVDTRRRP